MLVFDNMVTPAIRRNDFNRLFPRFDWRAGLMMIFVLIAAITMITVPRFAQPQAFHQFADTRTWLGERIVALDRSCAWIASPALMSWVGVVRVS